MSDELGPKARALLQATRFADDATQSDADRVHAAVLARVAVGTIVGGAASTSAAKSMLGTGALTAKVLTCVGLVTAVGVGATFGIRAAHHAHPRGGDAAEQRALVATAALAPAAPVARDVVPPAAVTPAPPAASSASVASSEARSHARAPAEASPLDAEVAILREARQALREGRATRALSLLDEHGRRFPRGVLAEDCAAERVFALCALGNVEQARAEGVRFLAGHALSPHADAVRASCGVGAR
jgi:hypothetical protein